MTTRGHVLSLLDEGHSYETAARVLGIPAGRVYLIATGRPVDSSDALAPEEAERRPLLASAQHLLGPPEFNPTRKEHVLRWVAQRAAGELSRP